MTSAGIGDDAVAAYRWIKAPLIPLPIHVPDIHKMEASGLNDVIDSTVTWILEATGLMSILDQVTGDPGALHTAAQTWLTQAGQVRDVTEQLQRGGRDLPDDWKGQASEGFGTFMGQIVNDMDSMAGDMGQAASILNQAGQECQLARDLVVMIIREAAEWAAVTFAATVIADIFTLGIASIAGAIAESAEMAAFVVRATEVSEKLGKALKELRQLLEELASAAREIRKADSFLDKVNKLQAARGKAGEVKELRKWAKGGRLTRLPGAVIHADLGYGVKFAVHHGYGTIRAAAGEGIGAVTGLPDRTGKTGLAEDIGSGAWGEMIQEQNLPVDAQLIDAATGTGPAQPATYHLPASSISAQLYTPFSQGRPSGPSGRIASDATQNPDLPGEEAGW